jgi:hypothetical protein
MSAPNGSQCVFHGLPKLSGQGQPQLKGRDRLRQSNGIFQTAQAYGSLLWLFQLQGDQPHRLFDRSQCLNHRLAGSCRSPAISRTGLQKENGAQRNGIPYRPGTSRTALKKTAPGGPGMGPVLAGIRRLAVVLPLPLPPSRAIPFLPLQTKAACMSKPPVFSQKEAMSWLIYNVCAMSSSSPVLGPTRQMMRPARSRGNRFRLVLRLEPLMTSVRRPVFAVFINWALRRKARGCRAMAAARRKTSIRPAELPLLISQLLPSASARGKTVDSFLKEHIVFLHWA